MPRNFQQAIREEEESRRYDHSREFKLKVTFDYRTILLLSPKDVIKIDDIVEFIINFEGFVGYREIRKENSIVHIYLKFESAAFAKEAMEAIINYFPFVHVASVAEMLAAMYGVEYRAPLRPLWSATIIDTVGNTNATDPLSKENLTVKLRQFGEPRLFIVQKDGLRVTSVQGLFSSMAEALGASIECGAWINKIRDENALFYYRVRLLGNVKEVNVLKQLRVPNPESVLKMDYFVNEFTDFHQHNQVPMVVFQQSGEHQPGYQPNDQTTNYLPNYQLPNYQPNYEPTSYQSNHQQTNYQLNDQPMNYHPTNYQLNQSGAPRGRRRFFPKRQFNNRNPRRNPAPVQQSYAAAYQSQQEKDQYPSQQNAAYQSQQVKDQYQSQQNTVYQSQQAKGQYQSQKNVAHQSPQVKDQYPSQQNTVYQNQQAKDQYPSQQTKDQYPSQQTKDQYPSQQTKDQYPSQQNAAYQSQQAKDQYQSQKNVAHQSPQVKAQCPSQKNAACQTQQAKEQYQSQQNAANQRKQAKGQYQSQQNAAYPSQQAKGQHKNQQNAA